VAAAGAAPPVRARDMIGAADRWAVLDPAAAVWLDAATLWLDGKALPPPAPPPAPPAGRRTPPLPAWC
jgi:hypothetical protein